MGRLTSQLLDDHASSRNAKRWRGLLVEVTERLVRQHGTPTLGNYRDPVREIFYIMLSARTTEVLYRRAHGALLRRFPKLEQLAAARLSDVYACIAVAGLGTKRAVQVRDIAAKLVADFPRQPSAALRRMSPRDAFDYLTALPGMGPKSALCVMMYSLDHDVFPVDVHVGRIIRRLGIGRTLVKHYQAQRRLPVFVPDGKSKELHVALVAHGRTFCLPSRPKCSECPLNDLCRFGRIHNGRAAS